MPSTVAADDPVHGAERRFESEPRGTRDASLISARGARAACPRLAPHAEDYGHDECLRECVTRVDRVELPRIVLMDDGADDARGLKPNPYRESKVDRARPVDDDEMDNKAGEHRGDDEPSRELSENLRRPHFRTGRSGVVYAAQPHPRPAEQDRGIPEPAHHKRDHRGHNHGPIVDSNHVRSFLTVVGSCRSVNYDERQAARSTALSASPDPPPAGGGGSDSELAVDGDGGARDRYGGVAAQIQDDGGDLSRIHCLLHGLLRQ